MLYETFMKNPKFTYALMMFYAFELRKTEIRQRHLAQMSTREKLVDTLIYLKEIFGMNAKEKSLNVILSRQELADIAGTTAEQITRELSELEKEKLIKKQGKKILLLNELALNKIISLHDTSEKYASWKNYDAEVLHRSENE
jgi:CRP-like cAMP-binding protein